MNSKEQSEKEETNTNIVSTKRRTKKPRTNATSNTVTIRNTRKNEEKKQT